MTKHVNLPTVIAVQSEVVVSKQRDSLVVRGLVAFQEIKKHELIRNSQNERYRQARIILNRFYEMEIYDPRNNQEHSRAFRMMKQLSDENFGKAYYPLCLSREGPKYPEDSLNTETRHLDQLAFDWCFANQGNQDVELWCDLGEIYLLGKGVEPNVELALYWFRKAAEQGDMRAQFNLGEINKDIWDGTVLPDECVLALVRYRLATAQGVCAQNDINSMLVSLDDIEPWTIPGDSAEALKQYSLAATQGYALAQYMLGVMYEAGEGVMQDYEEAVKWYRLAAEQGHYRARHTLGAMYRKGEGVAQDHAEAVKWYRLGATQREDWRASFFLGEMYEAGEGVAQDHAEAVKWYRLAAAQGSYKAKRKLNEYGIDWKTN